MQITKCPLATKLPSFTASHLAALLRNEQDASSRSLVLLEFRSVLRSQVYALLGNIVGLIPAVVSLTWILKSTGLTVMSPEYAHHAVAELHPWRSTALLMGALTGIELWFSSVIGGWFENFIVFRRIPEAFATNPRLRLSFGDRKAQEIAQKFLRNSSGVAANLALGFCFGFVPLLGRGLGFRLDGKHVTISTAIALFAGIESNFSGGRNVWGPSLLGLVLIGLGNLLVSFGLSLAVAVRAQNIDSRRLTWLIGTEN